MQRYWDFQVNDEVARLSDKDVAKQSALFFEHFIEAVRSHLVSDVPVGSCLSGGLDSSAVVSVINQLIKEDGVASVGSRQQTFSACYQNPAFDEQPYINHVIDWTGALSHRTFPDAAGFRRQLPQLIWHQEEPFVSTSMYAQWEVMRLAREKGVIVLLDGQGSDEQLLGYRKFYVFYIQMLLHRGQMGLSLSEFIRHFGSWDVIKTLQLRRGMRYLQGQQFGSGAVAHRILSDSLTRPFAADPLHIGVESSLGERIKADLTRFSLPSLLRYEDKNSMAFSREARVPFLDYRLVEFVASLPLNLKLRHGWTKYCLRRGGQARMPEAILTRKDKLGFATPEDDWFRQALAGDFQDTFEHAQFLSEFVNVPTLKAEFEAYVAGRRPLLSSDFFFRFYILEHWAKSFILEGSIETV